MGEMAIWKKALLSAVLFFVFAMWFRLRSQLGMNGFFWWAIMGAICLTPLDLMWRSGRTLKSDPSTKTEVEDIVRATTAPDIAVKQSSSSRHSGERPQEFSAYSVMLEKEKPISVQVNKNSKVNSASPAYEPIDEEAIYATALNELESNSMRRGIWAKAFANADGDINRAKASYIKARVLQLSASPMNTDNSGNGSVEISRDEHKSDVRNFVVLKQDQWQCKKCQEMHENQFDECWKCGQLKSDP